MTGDHPIVVEPISGRDHLVELCQGGDRGDRDEVSAPEAADLALHAALLMGTVEAWATEERIETVFSELRGRTCCVLGPGFRNRL